MATVKPSSLLITQIIEMSFTIAISLGQTTITTDHLLFALMQHGILRRYFTGKGVEVISMIQEVVENIEKNGVHLQNKIPSDDPSEMLGQLTPEVTTLFENVQKFADSEKRNIDVPDILLGLLNLRDSYCSYFMSKYGITED